jgi:hypothetical protein
MHRVAATIAEDVVDPNDSLHTYTLVMSMAKLIGVKRVHRDVGVRYQIVLLPEVHLMFGVKRRHSGSSRPFQFASAHIMQL